MGGLITAHSQLGVGSDFTFSFPVRPVAVLGTLEDTDDIADEVSDLDGHILLVEDNDINQMLVEELLDDMGLTCEIACNGQEAIDYLSERPESFALVLMDCQMPIFDGYQATQQLRKGATGSKGKNIPVIALTANAIEGDREKCLDSRMDDYLSKPIEPKLLKETMSRWLRDAQSKCG